MRIKPLNTERKPVDVSEWNDEIKAFFKPLGGFDTMVFVDYYFDWRDDSKSLDDRFKAGFKAALLALVLRSDLPRLLDWLGLFRRPQGRGRIL